MSKLLSAWSVLLFSFYTVNGKRYEGDLQFLRVLMTLFCNLR